MTPRDLAAHVAAGRAYIERQADRRIKPDLERALLNRVTAQRDDLKRELAQTRGRLAAAHRRNAELLRATRVLRTLATDSLRLADDADAMRTDTQRAAPAKETL